MNKVKVYTDGACSNNPGPGGWGAVFTDKEEPMILSGFSTKTTNNRMELLAVVKTLQHILHNVDYYKDTGYKHFEIYSDSAYVVNAINNSWVHSWYMKDWKTAKGTEVKNTDLWQRYLKFSGLLMKKGIKITLYKVKGHAGNTYNEYVDGIAKEEVNKARKYIATKKGGDI